MLLLGWSIVGLALGGTGTGGSDTPENQGTPGPDPDYPGPHDPGPYPDPDPPEPEDDSDGDFIPDTLEPVFKTDPFDWDSDNDHLSDGNEGGPTDPNLKDTDNDGI
jgi:hypothetical protein